MGMGKICSTVIAAVAFAGSIAGAPAFAGSSDAGNDWGSNYDFASPAEQTLRLLQADLIAKSENDYYDNIGKTNITVNNDNRQGSFDTVNNSGDGSVDKTTQIGDNIGQNTNVIGAVNSSTTDVTIKGDNNTVTATNGASNNGCLNGGITTIDGSSSSSVPGLSC